MLHELPITNVRLSPCSEDWSRMSPSAQGRHCSVCDRQVLDFTQASAATLARAFAAAPDGRVCGRFRLSQLAPPHRPAAPPLRLAMRRFLLLAVLLLVQGLSARQAWAQVQTGAVKHAAPWWDARPQQPPLCPPADTTRQAVLGYVERMPQPPGGMDGLLRFFRSNLHYPAPATTEGKVFVNFVVQADGQLTDFKVLKSLAPAFDAEALRVLRLMPRWTPGTQNGLPVAVNFTLPVTFRQGAKPPATKRRR